MNSKPDSPGMGIACMTVGMLLIPAMDAIAKHLGQHLSPMQITWGRFFFQFLFTGVAIVFTLNLKALFPSRPFIHAVRGLLLAIATTLFFFSLLYLPLADAIAIFFIQPMLLTILSSLFLGEKIGWHRRIAVLTGFAGAMLIIRPGAESFALASLLPLSAAAFFAAYITLTRSVANIDHPLSMQFSSSISATLLLSIALSLAYFCETPLFAPQLPSTTQWSWLATVGLISTLGHLLVVIALNRAPASLLAPFSYLEIVSATALGWLIFKDWPSTMSWIGIVVIVCSGMYTFVREQRQSAH